MEGFDPETSFGDETSKRYDALETRGDEQETVAFLARQVGRGDALEFAVGTGRIALPLTRAGVRVDGIELSRDMVDRMREKPGGENVRVLIGDMARVNTGRRYGLVYLVHNAIGPISLRVAHPPEFDLMARIAGLRLRQRASGWNGEPFTAASWRHVSGYDKANHRRSSREREGEQPA